MARVSRTSSGLLRHGAAAMVVALPLAAGAQTPAPIAFDVASVRLSTEVRGPTTVSPARVDYIYTPLSYLIQQAYGLPASRVSGPAWLRDVRVDIHAIPPGGSTRQQIPAMLQALLAERFGLVAHVERRDLDVHVLEVGPGGSRMREVQEANDLTREYAVDPRFGGAKPVDNVSETIAGQERSLLTIVDDLVGRRVITERTLYEDLQGENQRRELNAVRITMGQFATILGTALGEYVADRTSLTGLYQFRIPLPPQTGVVARLRQMGITRNAAGEPLEELPSGVSVHKSVETLGLRLEKKRIPLDVLVVDSMERTPKEN